MRQVRKGNVSIPLHIIEAFLGMHDNKSASPQEAAAAAQNLIKSLRNGVDRIKAGLDDSNLTVCIGKFAYVNPVDAQRFYSGQIPRLTIYRTGKENHQMPLYNKLKPSHYIANLKRSAESTKNKKGSKHGRAKKTS